MLKNINFTLNQQLNILTIIALMVGSVFIFNISFQNVVFVLLGLLFSVAIIYIEIKFSSIFVYLQVLLGLFLFVYYYSNYDLTQIKYLYLGYNLPIFVRYIQLCFDKYVNNNSNSTIIENIKLYEVYNIVNIFIYLLFAFKTKLLDLGGSNNLDLTLVGKFIPALVILVLIYSLIVFLTKKYTKIYDSIIMKVVISSFILLPLFYLVSYSIFREVGTEQFFIPLALAFIIYIVEELTNSKNYAIGIYTIIYLSSVLAYYFKLSIFGYFFFEYIGSFLGVVLTIAFAMLLNFLCTSNYQRLITKMHPLLIISLIAILIDKQSIIPIINLYESPVVFIIASTFAVTAMIPSISIWIYNFLKHNTIEYLFTTFYALLIFIATYYLFKISALTLDNVIIVLISTIIITFYNMLDLKNIERSSEKYFYLMPVISTVTLFAVIYSL